MPLSFSFSVKQSNLQRKKVKKVQQTVLGKPADSFKLAWFTLPDSFKIARNPCQTVLNFFGFLFTPAVSCYSISQSKWFCLTLKILKMSPLSPSESICKTCEIQVGINTTRKRVTFDFELIVIDCLQVGMGPGHRGSCCSRSCLYTVWTRLGGCYCWNDKSILNA